MPLRRILSDWGIPAGLACMVVAFAVGSAADPNIKRIGSDARWVVLIVLCAATVFEAARRLWRTRSLPPRGLLRFSALAGAFLALAAVSTAWSVAPRLTFERAGSLGVLFLLAAALASLTVGDMRARVRLFQGLAAGALAIGVLGGLILVFDYDTAVQGVGGAWRYRGFTENPNTIGIFAGAVLPILVALAIRSRSRWHQTAWLAGGLLMTASVIASESRGGLLAACAGALVVTTLGIDGAWHRVAAATALVAVFGGGIALRQAAQPPAGSFSSHVQPAPAPRPVQPTAPGASKAKGKRPPPSEAKGKRPHSSEAKGKGPHSSEAKGKTPPSSVRPHAGPKTERENEPAKRKSKRKRPRKAPGPKPLLVLHTKTQALPSQQDEIGHPQLSKSATTTLASGRLAEWKGTLELIGDRPILGYGFGTEQNVFVDRWYAFQGGTAENSYLGLLLQVGIVGLLLIAAIGGALAVGAARSLRFLEGDERVLVAGGLGVFVAAAVIMLIQSYLYSVGNIATGMIWVSLFALGEVVLKPTPKSVATPLRAPAHEAAA